MPFSAHGEHNVAHEIPLSPDRLDRGCYPQIEAAPAGSALQLAMMNIIGRAHD
jgi:hypothetical protein